MHQSIVGSDVMVVSPHHLASAAGANILAKGGNAFDAAITISATLAVVYPHMTSLGGDSFWLTYQRSDGAVRGYNASGRSSYQASIDRFSTLNELPIRGIQSAITVPGMVDGWWAVHQQYGKLAWSELFEQPIHYALKGFPMSDNQALHSGEHAEMLLSNDETARIYMPNGNAPATGENFKQIQLGRTLQRIAQNGRDEFYKGETGQEIAAYMERKGGLLTLDDLADHEGEWVTPISGSYRDYELYQMPPNSQGFTGIMTLQMLESFKLADQVEQDSYEYYQLCVEALKLSFVDRNKYLTDPTFSNIPLDRLLSKAYASELASKIQVHKALDFDVQPAGQDTAYAAVVDKDGNAISFIQSLYFEFGSGVVAGDTGILLQNRGSFFSLDRQHVNALAPHKRTFHTLMPAMACRNGRPEILYGTQGGEGQPQTQTAIFTRMVDYGLDPQAAINAPRWVWGRTWGAPTQELKLEGRIPAHIAQELQAAGHLVRVVKNFDGIMGHAHAIKRDQYGFWQGGSDPRCNGSAIGW